MAPRSQAKVLGKFLVPAPPPFLLVASLVREGGPLGAAVRRGVGEELVEDAVRPLPCPGHGLVASVSASGDSVHVHVPRTVAAGAPVLEPHAPLLANVHEVPVLVSGPP